MSDYPRTPRLRERLPAIAKPSMQTAHTALTKRPSEKNTANTDLGGSAHARVAPQRYLSRLSRASTRRASHSLTADLLALQSTVGNRAVRHLLRSTQRTTAITVSGQVSGPVVQRGRFLNLNGITDQAEQRAQQQNMVGELRYAVGKATPPAIISLVFAHFSNAQLERLPHQDPDTMWVEITQARNQLGQATFDHWIAKVGAKVLDLPQMKMLLTDESKQGTHAQAAAVLAHARPLPPFAQVDYDTIVARLGGMGYRRQEKYLAVPEQADVDTPYGQDVWTSDDRMVVRIKVGGRSINGRFRRPPHVVKEITKEAHRYAPADIIAKLTDDNILIPAGTKYSAKDIQSWYNTEAGGQLGEEAWKDPEATNDPDFIALFHRWTEGAHTAIGAVPDVPGHIDERQHQMLMSYRSAVMMARDFGGFVDRVYGMIHAQGGLPALSDEFRARNTPLRQGVDQAISNAEDVAYDPNFKNFYKKREKIKEALERWWNELDQYLSGKPGIKIKEKHAPFFKRLFADARATLGTYKRDEWAKLVNPDKK